MCFMYVPYLGDIAEPTFQAFQVLILNLLGHGG